MSEKEEIVILDNQIKLLKSKIGSMRATNNERLTAAMFFSENYGTDPDVDMLMDYHDFKVSYGDSFTLISENERNLIMQLVRCEVERSILVNQLNGTQRCRSKFD